MTATVKRSRVLPALYPAIALAVAAALLPSALRPPPEQTSDSAALNPNAPPDDQSEQVIQALRQAQGGGAGAEQADSPTTTTIPTKRPPASGRCIAGRQTESVYSASCAPAFMGSNGGATAKNVFPNEVRWGFWHIFGAPPEGDVADSPPPGERGEHRTFRVLEAYFNKRFQTFGRKVNFYGLAGSDDAAKDQAEAKKASDEYKLFGGYHLNRSFCAPFARDTGPVWCNPQPVEVYKQFAPNFLSFMIDRTAAAGFGAEYTCKKLIGRKAEFSGTERSNDRKISVVTEYGEGTGMSPSVYENALKKECGATFGGKSFQLEGGNAAGGAASAVTQMRSSGVTTVILEVGLVNTIYLMTQAQSVGWEPEWIIINSFGIDFNLIGTLLPQSQARHLFGLSAWEVPRRFEETECFQAYKEIDPDNDPDENSCQLFWHPMVLLMSAIQNAGPRLTPKTFQEGLYKLGHRFPSEPWAIGGGFGPDDPSYMDNVGEVWFSFNAPNPSNDSPGAYVWTYGARRFKRGELPADAGAQLFRHGVATPGGPDQTS
ncbi:MAG: hypothetical protein Q8K63_04005 [Acidimicrobiales bacterium]|nr:hypothetical protein [Acidimicrobiales bacterium]